MAEVISHHPKAGSLYKAVWAQGVSERNREKRVSRRVIFFCCPINRSPVDEVPEGDASAAAEAGESKGCELMDFVCFRGRVMEANKTR
jgi:hypothetical protein